MRALLLAALTLVLATPGRKIAKWASTITAIAVGYGLSRTMGWVAFLPFLCAAGAWAILTKLKTDQRLVPLFSILVGHYVWMCGGLLILASIGRSDNYTLTMTLIETGIVLVLVGWAWLRKSIVAVSLLMVVELTGFSILFVDHPPGMLGHVILHILLRIGGIGAGVYAIVGLRKKSAS